MTTHFSGILPAIVTPFDNDECFAEAPFQKLVKQLFDAGSDGLYINGQTGEGLLQPVDQRKRIVETAVACTPPGKSLIVHVGAFRTADAVELAEHAAGAGVQAISSLPPLGPYSFTEIVTYYRSLAAVSDLPVFVYHFPEVSPVIRTEEQILELLDIPNVAGLKFTDFDLYKLSRLKQRGCTIFNGRDEILVAGMLMKADGGIGTFYNLVPELFVQVYKLARDNRWTEAREVQERINDLIALVLRFPLFAAVKTILGWRGIDCGPCIAPRRTLDDLERESLRRGLLASGFAHLTSS